MEEYKPLTDEELKEWEEKAVKSRAYMKLYISHNAKCYDCKGSGQVETEESKANQYMWADTQMCPSCQGKGTKTYRGYVGGGGLISVNTEIFERMLKEIKNSR